jgi:DNA-binding transcriptional LysR family regulator
MNVPLYKQLGAKIDLKHLLHAVAAADHGSLRRAAEALTIQQSTLSRSIDQLEHAMSTKLFKRSAGGIVVSGVGADFIHMARAVLEQINEFGLSITPARKILLRIGFCTSLSAGSLRSNLLDFHNRFPQFRLSMLERRRSRLSLKLQNGTLDLVICTGKLPIGCKAGVLWSERVLIALPEDHPLADRDVVYWTDLRAETFLMSQYDPYWEFEDLITSKLSPDDRPNIEHHDVSRSILKSLISMKLGIGLVLESDVGVRVPSIIFKELQDGRGSARVQFSAFWREANDNPALTKFLRLLKERYPPFA